MRKILFICTGNFYRSRFAEAIFNHYSELSGVRWRAFSRGLAIHMASGDLSPVTERELKKRGIPLAHTGSTRVQLREVDLLMAHSIIALRKEEHMPMVRAMFPQYVHRVEYWDVSDIDETHPNTAFADIEERVLALISRLQQRRGILDRLFGSLRR